MAYTKTVWVNDSTPSIDATNLNNLETQYDEAIIEVIAVGARVTATQNQLVGSTVYSYKNFGGAL